jgi:hypothetical protein
MPALRYPRTPRTNRLFSFFFAGSLLLVNLPPAYPQQLGARITASKDTLQKFCGTTNVKLAFVNGNPNIDPGIATSYLYVVDFSASTPALHRLDSTRGGLLPVFSPNGQGIVFAKGVMDDGLRSVQASGSAWFTEFDTAFSPVKVADSAFVPRFVQNAANPAVIYSTCALLAANEPCNGCGKVMKKELIKQGSAWVPQAAQTVWTGGSYYGGMSYDNRYLAYARLAGPWAAMLDIQNSTNGPRMIQGVKMRNIASGQDTFYLKTQACNPSISQSHLFTDAMMFFDFGQNPIAGYTSPIGYWGLHTRIFISRYKDQLPYKVFDIPAEIKVLPQSAVDTVSCANGNNKPSGKQWDNPEWTNHPYFAVATARILRLTCTNDNWGQREASEAIYLINLKDSSYLKLVETTDTLSIQTSFKWPWAWIDIPAGFQEDTTWLKKDVYTRAAQPVVNPTKHAVSGNSGIFLHATTIFSASILRRVTVYTALGDVMQSVTPAQTHSVEMPILSSLSQGVYFIKAETIGGNKAVFRWIAPGK